jgi:hypothetical protein
MRNLAAQRSRFLMISKELFAQASSSYRPRSARDLLRRMVPKKWE